MLYDTVLYYMLCRYHIKLYIYIYIYVFVHSYNVIRYSVILSYVYTGPGSSGPGSSREPRRARPWREYTRY